MFYQVLLSPQAKRCVIITYIHGLYESPHKLPNDLRLGIFVAGGAFVPTQEKKDLGCSGIRKYHESV